MWKFSLTWFLIGIATVIAGALLIIFYKWIGDTFFSGLNSYQKIKLWGIIIIALGFIFITNLHSTILYALLQLILPQYFN